MSESSGSDGDTATAQVCRTLDAGNSLTDQFDRELPLILIAYIFAISILLLITVLFYVFLNLKLLSTSQSAARLFVSILSFFHYAYTHRCWSIFDCFHHNFTLLSSINRTQLQLYHSHSLNSTQYSLFNT